MVKMRSSLSAMGKWVNDLDLPKFLLEQEYWVTLMFHILLAATVTVVSKIIDSCEGPLSEVIE